MHTPVARNTCAHEKNPGRQDNNFEKGHPVVPKRDDDANAKSVDSLSLDHTKPKSKTPSLPFPITYRPLSAPPHHVNDALIKVADILTKSMTAAMTPTVADGR